MTTINTKALTFHKGGFKTAKDAHNEFQKLKKQGCKL